MQGIRFGTLVDALAAHEAVHSLDVGLVPLGVDILQPHGTSLVAGPALGTGGTVLFQLKQVELVEDAQQIPHRAHDTPEPLDKEAANQNCNSKKSIEIKITPVSILRRGENLYGTYIAEIFPCK